MFRKKIAGNGLFTGFAVRYGYGEAVFEQKIAKFGGTEIGRASCRERVCLYV